MESESGQRVRGREFPGLKHKELKEKAIAFYSENKVQDALETLLNEMFLSEPKDVFGYMVSYTTAVCSVSCVNVAKL